MLFDRSANPARSVYERWPPPADPRGQPTMIAVVSRRSTHLEGRPMTAMSVGAAVFVAGLLTTFTGGAVRGRLLGLSAMSGGALAVLVGAAPDAPGRAWTIILTAATLAGMVAFAILASRRLRAAHDGHSDRDVQGDDIQVDEEAG
jgi:hypothetical protein